MGMSANLHLRNSEDVKIETGNVTTSIGVTHTLKFEVDCFQELTLFMSLEQMSALNKITGKYLNEQGYGR